MAHEVAMTLADKFILSKDVNVEIKKDGKKLGVILISKGNIEWLPSGNHANKKRISWSKFAEIMESEGKDVRVAQAKKAKAA